MTNKAKTINWEQYNRVAVFIDVANVIYSLKDLRWRIDYKKLQKYFRKNSKLVDIYFYYSAKKKCRTSQFIRNAGSQRFSIESKKS